MDENASGPDNAKPAASPPRPTVQPSEEPEKSTLKASVPDAKSEGGDATVVVSSSTAAENPKVVSNAPRVTAPAPPETENTDGRDSDAETIVLPGKDGHSPSKIRKVKHEDVSDADDTHVAPRKRRDAEPFKDAPDREKSKATGDTHGKKKAHRADKDSLRPEKSLKNQDGSSGLSSAPTSPPNHRRRPTHAATAGHDSESDAERKKSPRLSNKDRAKSTDQLVSLKRKASRAASDDEHAEERKAARRRRLEDRPDWAASKEKSSSKEARSAHRETKTLSAKWNHDNNSKNGRSISPPTRAHRRSISTQLPSNSINGLSHKKKRLPAPLRSTEYHSDDSSASGNHNPRHAKVRNISTPATADMNMSPAKLPSSKRHVDAHGQTPLARACTKGEFEVAKQRLGERPNDIDFADYAGNTPLQSAAINGFEEIVELLINAGCNVDCVNGQKDTPLLDAVENGHLDVVKLLLAAGVNPRKANLEGEEPLDRINEELDNASEIRAALMEAKQRRAGTRKTSEELHHTDHHDGKSSHGADSPRQSPAPALVARRPGNVRAQKIGNHHLYVNLDEKTLRAAAARGDEETVTRVLQVKDGCDDSEAMVAAAKGGHDVVLQLLLALGSADPDPRPIMLQGEPVTPMLAAIGQENIKVVQLLLEQASFDPTRKFRGMTYYEIAQQKQGTNWKEEEQMLKDAFDAYKKSHRSNPKTKSPKRERVRAQDRDAARPSSRSVVKEEPREPRRNLASPSREVEGKKKSATRNVTSPKDKPRSQSISQHDEQTSPKRGHARPKKDDRLSTTGLSDREPSPAASQKISAKPKKPESDLAALSSDGEAVKPRRKLVSKGELRGERDKNRRSSMASNTPSVREPTSPREYKPDDAPEKTTKEPLSEKYHDRTKALKRDESRERPAGDLPGKRHRSSVTPPHSSNGEKDSTDGPVKRRRLDSDGKERRIKSTEAQKHPRDREGSHKTKSASKDDDGRKAKTPLDQDAQSKPAAKASSIDKSSIHVKSEEVDVEMADAPSHDEAKKRRESEGDERRKKADDERKKRLAEERKAEEAAKQKEADKRQREAEEQEARRREEDERKRKEEEEQKRAAEEARLKREAEEAKRLEEAKRVEEAKRFEEAKRAEEVRRAEEAKKAEEEAQRAREEAETRKREEDEKARLEAERKRKEEEEAAQKLRDEEERLRKEQLEHEAAEEARRQREEARRQREENERKERELRERQKREEAERKRAAHEVEVRLAREEERRQRLAKLPPLLRWLDGCANPQRPEIARKFAYIQGVRYDTIRPETLGTPEGREQWVSNHNVALLLGLKDLDLAGFTAWERVPAPELAKKSIWMMEADRYALTSNSFVDMGAELPDYFGGENPHRLHPQTPQRLRLEANALYLQTDMFFVKVRTCSIRVCIICLLTCRLGVRTFIHHPVIPSPPGRRVDRRVQRGPAASGR
jgi:hypothetical protein